MNLRGVGLLLLLFLCAQVPAVGQRFLMDLVDTTNQMGKGMLQIYERYNRVRISGYIQPQFQFTTRKGAETYAGGNFGSAANNRFMLRRGRLRVDYAHLNDRDEPTSYFVFQFDGTERGVVIRDFWGRFYENKYKLFALTTGMFARPFGHEVNLSSANRESPERGRMSQILMRTERDIGVMLTVASRRDDLWWQKLKLDAGLFNGQGLAGTMDFDSQKDLVSRISLKPTRFDRFILSGSLSSYMGGITHQSNVKYKTIWTGREYIAQKDSSAQINGKKSPRNYAGADFQIAFPNRRGQTEFRAEYVRGKQTATYATSETPGQYPVANGIRSPLYLRQFDGAYFYFLQHLGNEKHEALLKYDWYDPNTSVAGSQVTETAGFSPADLRYDTFGIGYVYTPNESIKFVFYYDVVKNERSAMRGFEKDISDDVFTCRVQYSF